MSPVPISDATRIPSTQEPAHALRWRCVTPRGTGLGAGRRRRAMRRRERVSPGRCGLDVVIDRRSMAALTGRRSSAGPVVHDVDPQRLGRGVSERTCGPMALVGVDRHGLRDDGVDGRWKVRPDSGDGRARRGAVRLDDVVGCQAGERRGAGKALVEHRGERVHVGGARRCRGRPGAPERGRRSCPRRPVARGPSRTSPRSRSR